MFNMSQQEIIKMALHNALQNEQAIASKYGEMAKSITDPTIQKHLQSLEQTARNHIFLLTEQAQRLNLQ